MNSFSRGVRNAFRNKMRTLSIVVILGLSMGLALSMLIANKAVSEKISSVKSSVGNTVTISPAGFSGFSSVNNSLTTSQLSKVSNLSHVVSVSEVLSDRLTTIGSSTPSFGGNQGSNSSSNNQTSLTSPITINTNGNGGGRAFISGGGSLPANFSPPVTIVGTNDPTSLSGTTVTMSSGSAIDGTKDSNDAMISSSMASKNNLKVGSTFTAYGTNLTVVGIFNSSDRSVENNVVVSLLAEQRLSGQSGDVTSAIATVDSLDNLSSATNAIKTSLGSSADVVSSVDQANQTVAPLNSVKSISLYSLIGAIIAGGIIILLTMVMIVRERTREIGVIKAIGGSNLRIALQFMTESVTLTLLGAVIGIILGVVAGQPITHILVSNSSTTTTSTISRGGGFGGGGGPQGAGGGGIRFATGGHGLGAFRDNFTNIHAAVGWSILGYGLLAAFVIAIFGSGAVSFFISKVRPAEVLRSE
jgi:putative ABC transport system permease protein